MAAGTFTFYESFREYVGDGTIDLDSHTFKAMLTTDTYTPNAGTHTVKADVTNEVSNGGYTAGGFTITQTWVKSGATVTFDSDNPTWTATGANLTAKYVVLYDDTPTSPADPLVLYGDLETTVGAGVTATVGNPLTINLPANGWFRQT